MRTLLTILIILGIMILLSSCEKEDYSKKINQSQLKHKLIM